jgi:UDP-N-acetylglucosamine--N-acetylmuramyl-(pentapeptide) pyrophosphoryl-undecaprenol N-acetylglucosamine transferase
MEAAAAARQRLPAAARERYRPIPFLTNGMAATLVAADLVLGRAGSSTCAEVAAVGVAAILVPYPYAHGHQAANAAWLADQGAAVAVPDAELTGERLRTEVAALRDDARRAVIANTARGLGRPDAARDVADALLALAEDAA